MQTTKTLLKDPLKILDEQLLPPDKLGVYASADLLYKGAVFGRDSLEVAEDLLELRPDVVEGVLLKLTSLQGRGSNPVTEEEPGRIHHEHRVLDETTQNPRTAELFHELSAKWGGNGREMTYYGSVDATPLFVRLALNYAARYGVDLATLSIEHKDGGSVNVAQAAVAGLEWITGKCTVSGTGLLEYQATNPRGLINQSWKDSREFYIHSNGDYANHAAPIASIGVQGYAYDALKLGESAFPRLAKHIKPIRCRLQRQVLDLLWWPGEEYFALGLDYDEMSKRPRRLEVITANPAGLLDSAILEDLSRSEQRKYVGGIVKRIFSGEFLTPAGIRSRSLGHADLVGIWDYHGSFVTWPKETYDIARGLERHGFAELSDQLKNRLARLIDSTGAYPEFVYVDECGEVLYNLGDSGGSRQVFGTNHPESPQAWTVSAAAAIQNLPGRRQTNLPAWKKSLQDRVLGGMVRVDNNPAVQKLPLTPYSLRRSD